MYLNTRRYFGLEERTRSVQSYTTLQDLLGPFQVRSTPVGLLDSSSSWCRLASCLGGQLLAWGLATGGLAGGLLGTSHDVCLCLLFGLLLVGWEL